MFSNKFESEASLEEEVADTPKHDFASLQLHLQKKIGSSGFKAMPEVAENFDFDEPSARIEHDTPVEIELIDEVKR